MAKITVNTNILTTIELKSEFSEQIIPKNSIGTVIECYDNPEGYAVDLAIPNKSLVGGFSYENLILSLHQFIVLEPIKLVLEPGYRLTLPQLFQGFLPVGTPFQLSIDPAGRIILTPETST